jgi:DNA-binding MarR family transcriptional regulator
VTYRLVEALCPAPIDVQDRRIIKVTITQKGRDSMEECVRNHPPETAERLSRLTYQEMPSWTGPWT